jgi:hypothetical protein
MEYVAAMASGDIMLIQYFMTIGSGIQVILRLLPYQRSVQAFKTY